ncbi:Histidine kinase-, DNA gyrase B-, and HSP90-like ATPase [Halorubrum aquaticum]|uniref:histidine kinase n=1 Tax=Halorubrum aquaticum TaxID=387340 RepID=A0A1I3C1I6_9EURY|nr:PAS domain-containing sensor histidine kinase [Halorubrum aquaticum]SFH67841.1 Histidine kinase-, DNA gyrase B-, and HSP90-like ATPase [Halorubrum aquaticum]
MKTSAEDPPPGPRIEIAHLPGDLDEFLGPWAADRDRSVDRVETLPSIAALAERDVSTVDCLVTAFRLADGTAVDLLETLAGRVDPPPVVLVVPVDDGTVPVEAVESGFDAVVPVRSEADDAVTVAERVDDAVRRSIPPRSPRVDPDFVRRLDDASADRESGNDSSAPDPNVDLDEWKVRVLDQLFTEIPLHMFVKDRAARNVMVSEALVGRRIHRLSDEYLGKRDIDGVVPDEEGIEPYLDDRSVLRTGESILEKEEYYPTSDRWFLTSKVPLRDDSNRTIGLVGVAQEITAQKHRERQLETVNHLVRHTMRNDLNAIAGWIEMLRVDGNDANGDGANGGGADGDGADDGSDGDGLDGEILERVQRIVNRLCSKIDKQQTVVDALTASTEAERRNLSRIVRREIDGLEETYGEATIRVDVEDGVSAVATDDVGMVLVELVENAVVHAERTDPRVDVVLENGDDEAVLRVLDRCPPIPIDEREILTGTKPIDQLNHSSGLGLWMARWIVENADGAIDFRIREEGGNEVVVTLPSET